MKKYTTIFFDFDGTLAHSEDAIHDTVNEVLTHFGYPPRDRSDTKQHVGGTALATYLELTLDRQRADTMRTHHLTIQHKHMHKYVLFPGVIQTLKTLQEHHYKLGVITSANRIKLLHLFELLDLGRFFTHLITVDDVIYPKPHTEPFALAMQHFGVKPEVCLMVGDTEADIAGAHNAKIDSVGATYSSLGQQVRACRPTYVIDHFQDLLPILSYNL